MCADVTRAKATIDLAKRESDAIAVVEGWGRMKLEFGER
jgi:hypothetical protein